MPLLLPRAKPGRSPSDNPDEYRLTLFEHLEELRDRLIRSVLALVLGVVAGWFLEPYVYATIEGMADRAIRPELERRHVGLNFVCHSATDAFMLQMRLAALIGLVIVIPYLIVQIWGFVSPGLKPNERKPFKQLAPFSVVLFFVGAGFCWMIMPKALTWFVSYFDNFKNTMLNQEAGTLTFFTLKMMAAFGIGFQLPLIVYGLALAGLLTGEALMQNWRQAATGIFVAAMVITPSNDLFSMLAMAIPLVLLFGASVVAVRFLEKKRGKLAKPDDYPLD
jgi:sec-independent protein translocase protein TatC